MQHDKWPSKLSVQEHHSTRCWRHWRCNDAHSPAPYSSPPHTHSLTHTPLPYPTLPPSPTTHTPPRPSRQPCILSLEPTSAWDSARSIRSPTRLEGSILPGTRSFAVNCTAYFVFVNTVTWPYACLYHLYSQVGILSYSHDNVVNLPLTFDPSVSSVCGVLPSGPKSDLTM